LNIRSFYENEPAFASGRKSVTMSTNGFEPDIVAFCCRHCAYAAADLAGSMRLEYPTAIKVVELPCTGKLDVLYVLRAFEKGADGVLVAG
jgi:F420-non-reducing hydrogenase iron-sulfur subunit